MAVSDCKRERLTLGTREPIGGPTKGMSIGTKDGILLFHAKPWSLMFYHFHDLFTCMSMVGFCVEGQKRYVFKQTLIKHTQMMFYPQKDVPAVFRLYLSTSHKTNLLGSLRKGSLNIAEGMRYMSLLEPSD